jgi:uncharacterized protein (TIGR02246 family)
MCEGDVMPSLSEDRDEIRDLFARYCMHMDTGEAEAWAALFTDDGVFDVGPQSFVGRDALVGFATSVGPTLHHMVLNEVIDVDGDVASCRASILAFAGGQIVVTGRYQDTLQRVGGRWRIAKRVFTADPMGSSAAEKPS